MADVHQHHQAFQAVAHLQVFTQRPLPFAFHLFRHFGVAITRQVDQANTFFHFKQVDKLGTARRFTGTRQAFLVGQGI
ncbi:hypothetical protein D3C78_1747950 [compost metagenome]